MLLWKVGDDARTQVLDGRRPRADVDGVLVAAADVLDLGGPVGAREENVGDAATLGVTDLLAELLRCGRDLGRYAVVAQLLGEAVAGRSGLLVHDGDEHRARNGPVSVDDTLAEQRDEHPADTERDADAGVGGAAVGGECVVPPAGADRAERLIAREPGLEDGAGVVVEATGDLQLGDDVDAVGDERQTALDDRGQLGEALVQQLVLYAE